MDLEAQILVGTIPHPVWISIWPRMHRFLWHYRDPEYDEQVRALTNHVRFECIFQR